MRQDSNASKYQTPPLVGEDQMINYEDFLKVANEAGVECQ